MSGRRLGGAAAAAVLVAASLVWVTSGAASAGQPQTQPPRRLTITSQSAFVVTGGEFVLKARIDRAAQPAPTEVVVTIYRPVQTRSEFDQTLQDRIGRPQATPPLPFPVSSLTPDPAGEVTLHVPLELGAEDGVFPVRVELRDRTGTALERIVTHLVYLAGGHTGPKLGLALVLPLHTGISLPPDAPRPSNGLDDVVGSVQALEANRALPFTLDPTPETVAALAASNEDRADRSVDALRRLADDHHVVGAPYVPVNLPHLLGAGLTEEVTAQIQRGVEVVTDVLDTRPDTRTWVATEPLDPESVDDLVRRGVEHIVADERVLEPVPDLSLTLSRPFVLAGREEDLPAVATDPGLAARFNDQPNQVLEAHRLLADLAVLWLDSPASNRRAVVAMAPPGWRATRAFLDTLANGLSANPVAEPVSLEAVFSSVAPAVTSRGLALVRHPADVPADLVGFDDLVSDVRSARRRLTSLRTVINARTTAATLLEDRLLVAQASELPSVRARREYVSAVETGIEDHLDAIEMPSGRSITLTARRGQIPITFQNRTGIPATVVVTVQSDKLEFPGGSTLALELARRNTTERIPVVSRTSGAFPLRVTLSSPDGNLLIGRAQLTVRSTAASRVSVAVSVGAAVFLAVWWGRHVLRGRRARRLVPA